MPTPRAAEGHDERAVLGELLDAVVLPVGDVDVAVAIGFFLQRKLSGSGEIISFKASGMKCSGPVRGVVRR